MNPISRALAAASLMIFLIAQTGAQFGYALFPSSPEFLQRFDAAMDWLFVSRIGLWPTLILLSLATPVLAVLAWRSGLRAEAEAPKGIQEEF
ncbi:hypothetical protein [Neomegalonema sp.]|uniref:hypothetical protein n=1 Tax=Neomegalonema sp. TaxID=2039713 RepID=UPI0026201763|nr:hypothetical protein [Neomegalonema sp.]MDD2867021.1 hypothetical protein [Neomegalonema sp.]